jgi:hypothetical protein
MPKNTQTQPKQPQPQSASPEAVVENGKRRPMLDIPPTRKGLNLFLMSNATGQEAASANLATQQEIRQRLAEAVDLSRGSAEQQAKAEGIAGVQARRLYQERISGRMSADVVTGLLGDVFGTDNKKDGTPSKTPSGLGRVIRDVTVRLFNAHEYVEGRDGGAYFDNLPQQDIKAVLNEVVTGKSTVWNARDRIGKIKSEYNNRPEQAFNPKHILKLATTLAEEGAGAKVRANGSLMRAYAELIACLSEIGNEPEEPEENEAVEAGADTENEAVEATQVAA